jgi:hypothetical protein
VRDRNGLAVACVYFEDDPKPVMAAVLLIHERRPVAQLGRKSTAGCQYNNRRPPMLPTLAFVLVTGFTLNNGAISTIVVPGLADENECHKLALKLNTPKHGCFEYRMAVPHIDVSDAIQDAQQDGIIR